MTGEQQTIDRLARDIEQKQAEFPQAAAKLKVTPPDEPAADRAARSADRQRGDRVRRRADAWRQFIGERKRRENCRLENYKCEHDAQRQAISRLRDYAMHIVDRIESGEGLILFGPPGTGKDHLVTALAFEAIRRDKRVVWSSGAELFGELRDRISADLNEAAHVRSLVRPDVLYLSDPAPPGAALTDYQAAMLYRIVDARYESCRPTWITVNVSSRQQLEERVGVQAADRLADNALVLACNWESYRKARR